MEDNLTELNERAIYHLKNLKRDNYVLYINRNVMDEDIEIAIKALNNQSVLNGLLGQNLKIVTNEGEVTPLDNFFLS